MSDELGMFAHPRPAIVASGDSAVVEAVRRLVSSEDVAEVVVGLPLSMSGEDSEQTRKVRGLVDRLREGLMVPVTTWDERLSSVQAGRTVREGRNRDGIVDSAAAALILQAVLDSRRGATA